MMALMTHALHRLAIRTEAFSAYIDRFICLIESHVYQLRYLMISIQEWRVIDHDHLVDRTITYDTCRIEITTQNYAMIVAILRSSFQGFTGTKQQQLAKRAIVLFSYGTRGKRV